MLCSNYYYSRQDKIPIPYAEGMRPENDLIKLGKKSSMDRHSNEMFFTNFQEIPCITEGVCSSLIYSGAWDDRRTHIFSTRIEPYRIPHLHRREWAASMTWGQLMTLKVCLGDVSVL